VRPRRNNSNTGTCTLACLNAACGDGFKQGSNGEECDDGNGSNTDACVATCKNAKCGDKFVRAGVEQCDDGNLVGNDLCSPTCTKPKLVFLTSATYAGNLGGLGGGDGKCQTLANAAKLGGTFKAWISNNTLNPQNRFVHSATGYARVDGPDIAKSWADLVDGSILAPINVNESKVAVGQFDVWTGTSTNGTSLEVDCAGWLTSNGFPDTGYEGRNNATNGNWTNTGLINGSVCSTKQRLYCFQQ
jgi:cysteine-rich repeat protein